MQYEGFVVYRSFYEAIEKIPEEEQLIAYKIMMDYALNDALPEDTPLSVDIIFGLIKPQIDKNRERAANGRKGGRKKKTAQKGKWRKQVSPRLTRRRTRIQELQI